MSINTNDTVAINNETKSDDSSHRNTRAASYNIKKKDDIETKLPNEIKALSSRKFIGEELTTYGNAIGKKKEGRNDTNLGFQHQ